MIGLKITAASVILSFVIAASPPTHKVMLYKSSDSHYKALVEVSGNNELQVWSINGKVYQVIYGERNEKYLTYFTWDWELLPGMTLSGEKLVSQDKLPLQHYLALLGCKGKGRRAASYSRAGDFVYIETVKKYSNCNESRVESVADKVLYRRLERTDINHDTMHIVVDP